MKGLNVEVERKAWECPRCKRVNAPHVDRCDCAPEGMTYAEVVKKYFDGEGEKQPEQSPLTVTLKPPYEIGTETNVSKLPPGTRIWYTNIEKPYWELLGKSWNNASGVGE